MDSTDTNTNTNDTDTQDSQVKEENKYEVIDFSVFSDKITNKEMENRIDEAIKNFNELEENSDEIDSKKEDISNAYHDNVDELNDIENNLNETKTKIENNKKQYEERNSKIDEEIAKNNEELIAKYQEVVKAQAELSALDPSDPTYIAKKDSLDELNKEAKTLDTEKNNLAKEKQELPTVKENIAKDMKEYDELAKMYNSRVDGLNEINNKIPEGVEIKDVNVNKVELFVPEKNDIAQEQIFQGGAPVQQYQEEDKNVTGEEENKDEQEKKEQTQEEQEETPEEKLHRVFDNIDEATPEEIKEALDGFDKIDFSNEDLECADRLNDRYHDLTGDYHEGFVNGTESKLKEKLDDIKNKRQEYKEQEKTGEELDKLNEDEAKYQFYYDRYKQIIEEKEREKEKE